MQFGKSMRLAALLCASLCLLTAPLARADALPVAGHLPDLEFSLTDNAGRPVTANDYRGKTVLLYFGFTSCSAQCPLTMARLSAALRALGPKGDAVTTLFVSIDPAHDTPEGLRAWLKPFAAAHPVGLTGSERAVAALARRYRAAYRPGSLAHGTAVYLFDGAGRARYLLTEDESGAGIEAVLKTVAASS
jgi:protein SCO1/2